MKRRKYKEYWIMRFSEITHFCVTPETNTAQEDRYRFLNIGCMLIISCMYMKCKKVSKIFESVFGSN